MHEAREPVGYQFEGPLEPRHTPAVLLYDVVMRFRHDRNGTAVDHLAHALQALGAVRVRRLPFVGPRIHIVTGRFALEARVKDDTVTVRLDNRVKGRALAKVVEALGAMPGAHDLLIQGTTPHFSEAYSDIGPCTPCAAGRFVKR